MESCSSAEKQASLKYFRFAYAKIIGHFSNQPWLLVLLLVSNYFLPRQCAALEDPTSIYEHIQRTNMNLKLSMALLVWVLFCRIWEMQLLGLNFSFSSTGGRFSLSQYSKKITALPSDSHKNIQVWETTQLVMKSCKRKLHVGPGVGAGTPLGGAGT